MTVRKTFANKSAVDLTGKEGYAVKYDTDGINLCSAITDKAIGVVTVGGATESEVCILGECEAKAGGAITAGNYLIPHTDGTVKNTTSSSTEFALAIQTIASGAWGIIYVYGSRNTVA